MNIIIICQEEPIYFGPFIREIILNKSSDIKLIAIAGNRGIGSHPKTLIEKIKNIYSLFLLFEPFDFFKNLHIKIFQKILFFLGLIGSKYDKRSIKGIAKKFNIPVVFTEDINSKEFIEKLKKHSPDVIINQAELIIKKELISIPSIGIINRHASMLPNFRGRVGSFWSHANEKPEYGVTIHFVDEKIDSGPIIVQKKYYPNNALSYGKILDSLFKLSVPLMLKALTKLDNKDFSLISNKYQNTKVYNFPTLNQIRHYRKTLKERRKLSSSMK